MVATGGPDGLDCGLEEGHGHYRRIRQRTRLRNSALHDYAAGLRPGNGDGIEGERHLTGHRRMPAATSCHPDHREGFNWRVAQAVGGRGDHKKSKLRVANISRRSE